ncbi:uncharacterized protein BX663DRAFT_521900 [Cokeromyces recurvatus]|uniref:uncharacterized protein n=1 Tax=Cokeromyces recurvatus TaxID=90255 RepID=UPI00221FD41B|nr:uncharacterized protein BX663DRAFT_521900 [Cokeromyces recurvatus]KAI7899235.1 hypothetical protein BX663DRAFT_521900 [Cokeromyces recurvatus]
MMNSKADLKTAREAIGKKEFNEAVKACKRVLLWEGENYNAWVFLGVAYTGLENDEEAEEAYKRAIEINPETMLAWQGLVSFYEKRNKQDLLAKTINQLIPRLIKNGDGARLTDYLKKLLKVYKDQQDEDRHLELLKSFFLPLSPHYDLIKDQPDLPPQIEIWKTIIAKIEKEQEQQIQQEVKSRRFRMNAGTPAQILKEVEGEVYALSKLDRMYETVLELLTSDDKEEREFWELRLLHLYSKRLLGVDKEHKAEVYEKMISLARKLKSTQDSLPLQLLIEFNNVGSPDKYNWELLNELIDRFPDNGLAKLAKGYQLYKSDNMDEAFNYFSEGLDLVPNSLFGHLCVSQIYYESKEYETSLEYATQGRDLARKIKLETGYSMMNAVTSLEICMAHCYRLLDKKYHGDAMTLYKQILQRNPDEVEALEGTGLILIEERRWDEAMEKFKKINEELDPLNHKAIIELGWICYEKGDYESAIQYTTKAIEMANNIADYYYRLGRIYWSMEDTGNAFNYFMQAVKLDPYFASGFTYLGHYYREIKKDHGRAKKCYQKAYALNTLDSDAAFHLSDYLVAEHEEDKAEAIFIQMTESCPKVGWAWRRMGYIHMNTHSYNEAIVCFQKALRTDTSDVRCWEGLAESYSKAGRYVASLKAFQRATQLDPTSIHAHHEQATVQQKVGLLDDAIQGFQKTLQLAEQQDKPNYIPSLVGLAEAYLEHAKEDFQAGFFGRSSDGCHHVLTTCLKGIKQDATVLMFWKLIGDACMFYRQIPQHVIECNFELLQAIIHLSDTIDPLKLNNDMTHHWLNEFLSLEDVNSLDGTVALTIVFSCAAYAYKQAIVLSKNHQAIAPAYWHDLGFVYYQLGLLEPTTSSIELSIRCVQVALKLEPIESMYWNTLGVIAMSQKEDQKMLKMAQYAFIKAMEFNNKSAIPWTNYGFLCLTCKDYELANQAFEMAHGLDPEWISAWVGQAYAASLWKTDAGDLFEHAFMSNGSSNALATIEASYGYASTVYYQHPNDSNAVVMAIFALEKLTQKENKDAVALNLLGLLLERLGQYERAAEAFASAILALESNSQEENKDERLFKVHANLGRVLCAAGDFEGAIRIMANHAGDTLSVYSQLNAGIAYYFLDKLPESLSMFEMALNATVDDIELRQDVIVLLSKVLWALGGEEQRSVAKDQLFSCITENPTYLPAIFSLCVMGILEDDETLTTAALQELAKVPAHVAYESDKEQLISWLFSKFYKLKNIGSMRALIKSVHQTPWLGLVWSRLSKEMVDNDHSIKQVIASSSLVMSHKSYIARLQSEAYEYAALANNQDQAKSKKYAQRSIMMAPWRLDAWKTLNSI